MSKVQTLRGMNDIRPDESKDWSYLEDTLKSVVKSYGYDEIRFPIVEKTELYTRSNEAADIVTKEMYTFEDKGGESISLRPEGTAGCVRAAIESDLLRTDKPRLWYSGPMFRYERPQKGRSRQFHQFSAEAFGLKSPEIDAELIIMSSRIWKNLGIYEDLRLEINNLGNETTRNMFSDALVQFLKKNKDKLDEETIRKMSENPLRILDSKSSLIQNLLKKGPSIDDYLDDEAKIFQTKLLGLLDRAKIKYTVNRQLVRGLDYYNQTVFEWKTNLLGSQDTVLGGGRYDSLVEELGGKPCPAIGFSIGMERLLLLLRERGKLEKFSSLDIYFLCFNETATQEAIMYSENLKEHFPDLNIKINLGLESASSQFKKADKSNARMALILGEDELNNDKISYKDLRTKSDQESLTFQDLLIKLKQLYK
jgi:histidyl-tRNA synthetase|tara:strand:+ start:5590 stop:6858 length:1269 start_codon:yes stop_codon:yes gene_type:complete